MTALLIRIWLDSALVVAGGMSLYVAVAALGGAARPGAGDVPRFEAEPLVFRHHRAVGVVFAAAATFYLVRMHADGLLWPDATLGAWSPVLRVIAVAMAMMVPLATTLFVRPSLLRPVEARLNRWVGPADRAAPRWLRLASGVYCFPALVWLLAERMH